MMERSIMVMHRFLVAQSIGSSPIVPANNKQNNRGVAMLEEETDTATIVPKPSRATRLKRSIAARIRRRKVKQLKVIRQTKIDKEAKERVLSKLNLE